MTITNGYTTLETLKAYLDINDSRDDALLERRIEAASRQVDGWCGRVFYAETDVRSYTAEWADALALPDDLISITTLSTDDDGDRVYEAEWALTDYDLEPTNRSPKTRILVAPNGTRVFPTHRLGVQILGSWGYASEPPGAIVEATLLQATRLYKRKDAPFGIAGTQDLGTLQTITGIDPDVKQLLMPFRKMAVVGV